MLTTFDTDAEAFASLQAGASGFLLKNAPPEELLAAIRVVFNGDAVVAPRVTRRILDRFAGQFVAPPEPDPRLDELTAREREVLLLVAQGLTNLEIADRLSISEATVKVHVGRILTKLGLRDRVQIVVMAHKTGLVKPGRDRQVSTMAATIEARAARRAGRTAARAAVTVTSSTMPSNQVHGTATTGSSVASALVARTAP
jgi:DNA-binding CsgD family transcriptional regulator